jgi:hypothetical protein
MWYSGIRIAIPNRDDVQIISVVLRSVSVIMVS